MLDNGVWIGIISHNRAANVSDMQRFAPLATWYVKDEADAAAYRVAGAEHISVSGGLIASRNRALEDAFARGLWCLQLSDDLRRMQFVAARRKVVDIDLEQSIAMIREAMARTGAYLGGVAATSSRVFAKPEKPVSTAAFILGDFMLVKSTPLRFDVNLRLKEDYDYTAQHLKNYGRVARCNLLLMTFLHHDNPGGVVDNRTDALEDETIAYLKQKWGRVIVDHPRRPHQIILKVR